jgi:predicted transglutaminase-like cysteine proteinase
MRFAPFLKALIVALLLAPSSAYAGSLFQSGVPGSHGFAYFPFWQQVLNDMAVPEQPSAAHADAAHVPQCVSMRKCVPVAWTTFLDSIRKQPRRAQLSAVNQWANAKPYVEDIVNWHVADYWATPGEFIVRGGDCEDYAITKYFSLVRLGFSPDDLRIVIVNDVNLNAFHAVLAVRDEGTTWLLDNQLQQVVSMDVAVQYQPIYSLNEHGWWLHSMPKISLGNVTIAAGGNSSELDAVR